MKIQIAIGASCVVACACSLATAQVDSPSPYTSEFRFPAQPDWVEGEELTPALGDSYVIPTGMMFGEGSDFWFGNSADDKSIPDIDGTEVDYIAMNAIFGLDKGLWYKYEAPGNGESTPGNVFQYTMVFDVFIPGDTPDGVIALWQGNATNYNNAELFIDTTVDGLLQNCGEDGTFAAGGFARNEWFRIVQVVNYDTDQTSDFYINGKLVAGGVCSVDWLWGFYSALNMYLLTDDTESAGLILCANFALSDTMLDADQVAALGGPSADGIFTGPNPPEETGAFWDIDCNCVDAGAIESSDWEGSFLGVGTSCASTECPFEGGTTEAPSAFTSEWRFDDGAWEKGSPLTNAYGTSVCAPTTMAYGDGLDFWFANTADGLLPQIDGQDVDYLALNNVFGANKGLSTLFNAPGNGDGAPYDIFEFTLIFDVFIPAAGDPPVAEGVYQALWNGNATNSNDAEFFLRCDTQKFYIAGCGQQGADGSWPLNEWFRVAQRVDYNSAVNRSDVFVNGVPVVSNACAPDWLYGVGTGNPVWLLSDDTDGDTLLFYCANMAIVDVFMSEADLVALAGPNAAGIFSGLPEAAVGASYDAECGCSIRTAAESAAAVEVYMGDETTCEDTECPLPPNNVCDGAELIVTSETMIDSTDATSSGVPFDDALCPGTYMGAMGKDVWYQFIPATPGLATITTCDLNGFDTSLILYVGDHCAVLVPVACNGDMPADPNCQAYFSMIEYAVEPGVTYTLRVGGYYAGSSGPNLLSITGIEFSTGGTACEGDFNDDGAVNGADFGILLAEWGPCAGCDGDVNGDGEVNGADVGLMLAYWGPCPADPCDGVDCEDNNSCTIDYCLDGECFHSDIAGCYPGCGEPDSGDCSVDNGTPGCNDLACCSYVCKIDSFCCEVIWDATCADLASGCP